MPDPSKIRVIEQVKTPTKLSELRTFLGLTGYYRRFVEGYADIVEPLIKLTREEPTADISLRWNEDCTNAIEILKRKLITAPILAFPNFDRDFILYADASNMAMGAVLAQLDDEGREVVIAYAS